MACERPRGFGDRKQATNVQYWTRPVFFSGRLVGASGGRADPLPDAAWRIAEALLPPGGVRLRRQNMGFQGVVWRGWCAPLAKTASEPACHLWSVARTGPELGWRAVCQNKCRERARRVTTCLPQAASSLVNEPHSTLGRHTPLFVSYLWVLGYGLTEWQSTYPLFHPPLFRPNKSACPTIR